MAHELTIRDALQEAAKNKEFAAKFMKDPTQFKAKYNLSDAQIKGVHDTSRSLSAAVHHGQALSYE